MLPAMTDASLMMTDDEVNEDMDKYMDMEFYFKNDLIKKIQKQKKSTSQDLRKQVNLVNMFNRMNLDHHVVSAPQPQLNLLKPQLNYSLVTVNTNLMTDNISNSSPMTIVPSPLDDAGHSNNDTSVLPMEESMDNQRSQASLPHMNEMSLSNESLPLLESLPGDSSQTSLMVTQPTHSSSTTTTSSISSVSPPLKCVSHSTIKLITCPKRRMEEDYSSYSSQPRYTLVVPHSPAKRMRTDNDCELSSEKSMDR